MQKKVDESWKEDIKKEKDTKEGKEEGKKEAKEEGQLPEADFRNFMTGLVMQCFMFMGEIPDPVSKKKQKNLPQAKYIIDTIMMLSEKTQGNLSKEEGGLLEGALHELQMRYVKLTKDI